MDQLTSKDMEFIGDAIFPSIDKEIIAKMVEFSNRVCFSSLYCCMALTICLVSQLKAVSKSEDT